jgi:tripartite-type tricarboxylate transporter receptor subunit TctC
MIARRRSARSVLVALVCATFGLAIPGALAQDGYPAKPIKLIVPLAAGGGIDFTARTAAQKLSDVLGPAGGGGKSGRRRRRARRERRRARGAPTVTHCCIIPCPAW